MKKTLLLSFVLFYNINLNAQTTPWINQGATWFYSWWIPGSGGNDKIEYTQDTIILGKICEVLKTTRYVYGQALPGSPISLISTQILPNNFTYNNGDTVFYLNHNQFNVLYNFGAQTADQWDLGFGSGDTLCTESIVKVDSISNILINTNCFF